MNTRALILGTLAFTTASAAVAAPSGNLTLQDLQFDGFSLPGDPKYGSTAMQDYTVLGGNVSSPGVNFGCDGVNVTSITSSFQDQWNTAASRIGNIGPGLALNMIIWSQPMLYEMLSKTQQYVGAEFRARLATCSSIRRASEGMRKEIVKEAESRCLESGKSNEECADGQALSNEAQGIWGEKISDVSSNLNNFVSLGGTGAPSAGVNCPAANSSNSVRMNDVAKCYADSSNPEVADYLSELDSLVPSVNIDQTNGITHDERTKTVPDYVNDETANNSQELKDIVTDYENARAAGFNGQAGQKLPQSLSAHNQKPHVMPMPLKTVATLADIKANSPVEYEMAINAIARAEAIAKTEQMIAFYEGLIQTMLTSGAAEKKVTELEEAYQVRIAALKSQLHREKLASKQLAEQREILRGVEAMSRNRANEAVGRGAGQESY